MSGKPIDEAMVAIRKLARDMKRCSLGGATRSALRYSDDLREYADRLLAIAQQPMQQGQAVAWQAEVQRAIERARVFDDGSDGADAESAQSVVGILSGLLNEPPMQQGGGEVVNGIEISEAIQLGRRYIGEMDKRGRPRAAQVFEALLIVAERRTAPPSAPVGVEGLVAKWREEVGSREGGPTAASVHECADELEAALAQQPAAVDEAMVERAYQAWRKAAVAREGNKPAIRAALTAALTEARNG